MHPVGLYIPSAVCLREERGWKFREVELVSEEL